MLRDTMELDFFGTPLVLSAQKCVFLPAAKTLLIADLHLGKVAHFRRNAIPLPQQAQQQDYDNLQRVLNRFEPETLLVLGDLFHSSHNHAWDDLVRFRAANHRIHWQLVMGNHDILGREHYLKAGIECVEPGLELHGLGFFHEPPEQDTYAPLPRICGHVHPGAVLRGKGRDRLVLPCFYLKEKLLMLPAFGALTGFYKCRKEKPGERLIGISAAGLLDL